MAKKQWVGINVTFKQTDESEMALYARVKKLRCQSAFMKDAAKEKFDREDELKALHSQPRKSIQPPRGFDV